MTAEDLGVSSALQPAGIEADVVANLFWIMTTGGVIIWILTLAIAAYAAYGRRRAKNLRASRHLIVMGGVMAPAVVLGTLLIYGLSAMGETRKPGSDLQILVTGERFWWRVQYAPGSDAPVDLANEIRIPVGQRTELLLRSPEVIHSLWIPALAGKVDMLPGRETRLVLEPTRVGRYRGVCAEYCGTGHAHMAFTVDVLPPEQFSAWLQQQRKLARAADTVQTRRGEKTFAAYGCAACHTVRGRDANGVIGPDLTHVGSRPTLGAASLAMDQASLQKWIRDPAKTKHGVLMPAYNMIPEEDLEALSAYLLSLK